MEAHGVQGKANQKHRAPAENDTADFSDGNVGNLRVDYVLPSSDFQIVASGVFWPKVDDSKPEARIVKQLRDASDHHLVWIDVTKSVKGKE